MRLFALFLALYAVPATVFACEGECIIGITNAFLRNYHTPIHKALEAVAAKILTLIPPESRPQDPVDTYFQRLLIEYNKTAYPILEKAIFPSYFHGKCQRNGIEPPGCPNSDCPVVCGTPGSLVHFYPKLRFIVFDCLRTLLESLVAPGSASYKSLEDHILADATHSSKRMVKVARGSLHAVDLERRSRDVKEILKDIIAGVSNALKRECDGEVADSLKKCSWERRMKAYILTWP